jgi:hypothetical protein
VEECFQITKPILAEQFSLSSNNIETGGNISLFVICLPEQYYEAIDTACFESNYIIVNGLRAATIQNSLTMSENLMTMWSPPHQQHIVYRSSSSRTIF